MLSAEVLRQVRRIHLWARRRVNAIMSGEYHSAFKGSGLIFDEVREYLPGDDVRTIDWNVTARMGHPYIKRFVEDRELTVILAVDLSASQRFGTQANIKRVVAAEIAALLALCAASNNDRVGLLAFTEDVEQYLPPKKGPRHVLRVLRDILGRQPRHPGTNLAAALDFLNKVQRRRAIVFLLSDFLAPNFDRAFVRAARKHDLIAVRIQDPREQQWPAIGLVRLEDLESGHQVVVDTSNEESLREFAARAGEHRTTFANRCRGLNIDLIDSGTDGNHFNALINFFRMRDRRRRHG